MPENRSSSSTVLDDPPLAPEVAAELAKIVARATLVGIPKLAALLDLSRTSIYALIGSGALPTLTIGGRRVASLADVEAFVRAQRQDATDGAA